ncbi:hypothetical protein UYSO10_1950 [Kosakonia radicincitans]|uniref:hypothetical protein n=1 Tax=Kosakonia radicincitans TaxID=283686 RepID=UPI00118261BA|nr:hypothetical protein [Kosakonia radicincitans]VVT48018.1 hypothetical protein UYSO10_1950 [Kosakonia radicincitans]
MTTTVFDAKLKIVASDSRWSAQVDLPDGIYLVYADDTNFHKIVVRTGAALVLAGDGQLIAEWKNWWVRDDIDSSNMPDVALSEIRLVSVMLIARDGTILFDAGPKKALLDVNTKGYVGIFSGTGSDYAAECFDQNRNAVVAVNSAKEKDLCSGGTVMFTELATMRHNLHSENYDYNSVVSALQNRGMIMKIASKNNSANDASSIDISAHAHADYIRDGLSSGSIRACAPSGESEFRWTEARIEKLKLAIDKVVAMEKEL